MEVVIGHIQSLSTEVNTCLEQIQKVRPVNLTLQSESEVKTAKKIHDQAEILLESLFDSIVR